MPCQCDDEYVKRSEGYIKTLKPRESSNPKPIFRWAGSKRRILDRISAHIPQRFGKYIEPFAGSAALFFHLAPQKAILGDINSELIFAYQELAKHPKPIWELATLLPKNKDVYYPVRSTPPRDLDAKSRVARFLYLNRYCFNGLYRTNQSGQFNVPMGRDTGAFASWPEFQDSARQLKRANFVCCDFEETISYAKRGDFIYLDPPYADSARNGRNEYGTGSFQPSDIPRLMTRLESLHKKGVRFLLSYSSSPDFIAALHTNSPRRIRVPRMIAANPRFRRSNLEILVHNDDLF